MSEKYKIVWTREADQNVGSIIEYLEHNWGQREINNFLARLRDRISLISQQPELFPPSELIEKTRRSVLSKQTTIYYRIEKRKIVILHVFNTRQSPDKLGRYS